MPGAFGAQGAFGAPGALGAPGAFGAPGALGAPEEVAPLAENPHSSHTWDEIGFS